MDAGGASWVIRAKGAASPCGPEGGREQRRACGGGHPRVRSQPLGKPGPSCEGAWPSPVAEPPQPLPCTIGPLPRTLPHRITPATPPWSSTDGEAHSCGQEFVSEENGKLLECRINVPEPPAHIPGSVCAAACPFGTSSPMKRKAPPGWTPGHTRLVSRCCHPPILQVWSPPSLPHLSLGSPRWGLSQGGLCSPSGTAHSRCTKPVNVHTIPISLAPRGLV